MRIDAASMLAEIFKARFPDWDFEVVATDKGNANVAATSKDLQSSFLISSLPPTRGKMDAVKMEDVAAVIAAENPALRSDGVNVYGQEKDYSFDATVQPGRVSIHIYCDALSAKRIAKLLRGRS